MIQKAKILLFAAIIGVNGMLFAPDILAQSADITDMTQNCTQWQIDNNTCQGGLRQMVKTIMNWFLLFLGLTATAFLIYGGFMYITSAGNNENIDKAKKLIIYAAVGIIIVILAAVLVNALLRIPTNQGAATQ